MTIDEMFRRIVRAHLGIIAACVLVPLVAVLALAANTPDPTLASMRLQVIAGAPKSATEAEGMSSRVLALATTPSLLDGALDAADTSRDLTDFATNHVSAQRLGESSIVELSVTDDDPVAADRIVAALATRVALFMNQGDRSTFDRTMADLDSQIEVATANRDKLVAQLRGIADVTARADLGAQIQSANQLLSQLTAQRTALSVDAATRDQVVTIGTKPEVRQIHPTILPRLALALLLGLVLGLTVAAVLETVRPRVNGIRALARLLQAPVLGESTEDIGSLHNKMALAARRQGVDAVVLVGADDSDADTVSHLLFALSGHTPSAQSVRSPSKAPAGDEDNRMFGDGGLAAFSEVRFTGLSAITPQDEMTAGIVVVSAGNVLVRRLDDLDDILKAVRWPVLGLVRGPAKRRFRGLP
jgi:capsular polysaccharide biosynthesis protein